MATSKTLAPTNVTISIPAMTDQPNASVLANCADKEADAINALNSQMAQRRVKGTFTNSLLGVNGFVTTSGTILTMFIPMNLAADISGISISSMTIALRIPSGGYLLSNNEDVTSDIDAVELAPFQGGIYVTVKKNAGFGTTNNIPVVGTSRLTYTLS